MAFRIPRNQGDTVMRKLWLREMPNAVYDPRWLPCRTPHGAVKALAFTLSRQSPHHTGELAPDVPSLSGPGHIWHNTGLCPGHF
jgi:cation transport protein ChaC